MEQTWTKVREFTLNLKYLSSDAQVESVLPAAVMSSPSAEGLGASRVQVLHHVLWICLCLV